MGDSKDFFQPQKVLAKVSLERLLVPIALVSLVTIIVSFTLFYKIHANFFAINGAYQTFNPIRRIFDGEVPALDFNLYLGIGTTYLITFLAFFTGKDFGAVNFSTHFWHLFCHFLAFLTLFYLLGLSIRRSLFLAAAVVGIITLVLGSITILGDPPLRRFLDSLNTPFTTNYPLLPAWRELISPGLSNLGLRSALPFLTSLLVLAGIHYLNNWPTWLAVYCGSLIGIQPLWSNDYGIISTLVLIPVSTFFILKQQVPRKWQLLLALLSSSLVSFVLMTSVITHGHPDLWIQESVLGVASDQFWYFGFAPSKIFALSQLFPEPYLYWYAGLLGILLAYVYLTPVTVRKTLLLYVALTTFGAGLVASIGGGISTRYFVPTLFVSYFVLAFFGLKLLKFLTSTVVRWNSRLTIQTNVICDRLPISFLRKGSYFLLVVIYVVGIVVALDRIPSAPNATNYFYVNQLGGWLPDSFLRAIAIAEKIRLDTQTLPPERRILSTYASMIDTLAGSKNATGIDYIIHALGESARQRYLDRYQAANPQYITTIREDYSAWENWVRRVNWWFYREFLRDYEPVEATFYNMIWRRREQPLTVPSAPIQCAINLKKPNSVNLTVTSDRPNEVTSDPIYFIDLELDYALHVQSSGVPVIGSRGLVNATEVQVAIPKAIPADGLASYGLPPHHSNWHIPVIHRLGETSIVNLTGFPEARAVLEVSRCQAEITAPATIFEITRPTTAKNVSDEQWQNGIAINTENRVDTPSKAGFLSQDPIPYGLLLPGMMIKFPRSGLRKVIEVRGNEIWVSGDSLDPKFDGYPNTINLEIK